MWKLQLQQLDRLYQNRIRVGAEKGLGDRLSLNLYYMNIATDIPGDNDRVYSNVIGTDVIFSF